MSMCFIKFSLGEKLCVRRLVNVILSTLYEYIMIIMAIVYSV